MAIRFEYGPPPSALGALAYQAGAAEAADKRRREIEQMQMQAAQMRQQQQQNALNRQFDSWKTQYSHHSSLDKMQRDYKWREEQAEQNRALEKEKFGLQNERKDLEWDRSTVDRREMFKLEAAENNRRDIQDQQQWLEQEQKKAETAQDVARVQKLSDKSKLLEARQWKAITPEAQREVMEIDRKIEAVQASEQFMPQPLEDQRDPSKVSERQQKVQNLQKKRQAILADPKKQRKDLTQEGGEEITPLTISTRVNGKLEERPNPMATAQDAERKYGVTDEVFYDMKTNRPYKNKVVRDDNPSSKTGWKVIQAGTGGKSEEEKQQDVVTRDEAINDAYKNLLRDDDSGFGQVLNARGRAIAISQGRDPDKINESKNFDPVITEHVNTIHKPEKAAPDPGEGAALGGQGRPFSYEPKPVIGEWAAGDDPVQDVAAKVNTGVEVNTQEAMMAEARADQVAGRTAESLRPDYEQAMMADWDRPRPEQAMKDAWDKPVWEGAELTPEGYGLNDPHIDESERQRRQQAFSEALTRQGRGGETGEPGAFEARHDPDVTKRPKGWPVNRTPTVGARTVEKTLGGVEAVGQTGRDVGGFYKEAYSVPLKAVAAGAKKGVIEPAKGFYHAMGKTKRKKVAAEKRHKATETSQAKVFKKGTPGVRIKMPVSEERSLVGMKVGTYREVSPKDLSRKDRERYEKFNKDLRGYTHRLLNNKDAVKDVDTRINRIREGLSSGDMSQRELADEIRVIKMLGRSADVSKPMFLSKNKVWKDFLSKDLDEMTKLFRVRVGKGRNHRTQQALLDTLKDAGF